MNWNKLKNQPFVTIGFLSIQTAVFLLAYLLPGLLIEFRGSMFGPLIALNHEYWRFVTPIFIHYGLMHFAINSVILYYMGQQVEAIYGHGRFFLIYLLSGVMGNVLGFAFNDMNVQAAGASLRRWHRRSRLQPMQPRPCLAWRVRHRLRSGACRRRRRARYDL